MTKGIKGRKTSIGDEGQKEEEERRKNRIKNVKQREYVHGKKNNNNENGSK